MKLNASLLFIAFLLTTGCTAIFTEQKYVLIDEEVKETFLPSGMLFSISKKRDIRKFVILGEGTIRNIDIYARDAKDNWKLIKKMKKPVTLPLEIHTIVHADAIRILQKQSLAKAISIPSNSIQCIRFRENSGVSPVWRGIRSLWLDDLGPVCVGMATLPLFAAESPRTVPSSQLRY